MLPCCLVRACKLAVPIGTNPVDIMINEVRTAIATIRFLLVTDMHLKIWSACLEGSRTLSKALHGIAIIICCMN
jgi:hypothetical protein